MLSVQRGLDAPAKCRESLRSCQHVIQKCSVSFVLFVKQQEGKLQPPRPWFMVLVLCSDMWCVKQTTCSAGALEASSCSLYDYTGSSATQKFLCPLPRMQLVVPYHKYNKFRSWHRSWMFPKECEKCEGWHFMIFLFFSSARHSVISCWWIGGFKGHKQSNQVPCGKCSAQNVCIFWHGSAPCQTGDLLSTIQWKPEVGDVQMSVKLLC